MPPKIIPETKIDDEWSKFMNRMNKNDDDEDSCGDDDDIEIETTNLFEGSSAFTNNIQQRSCEKPQITKRTCISKKQQRKTYSFVDDDFGSTIDTTTTAGAAPAAPPPSFTSSTDASIPKSSSIYISTKTKIAYLNKGVDIYNVFWDIPIVHYYTRRESVIKKQIKFQTTNPNDIVAIKEKLKQQNRYYEEQIIEHIDNPNGRIVFKDQRKVSIGICKKDLLNNNSKRKRAFFNCFVLILRIQSGICTDPQTKSPQDDILFKEMHVKVFNTGKLEIPGIQDERTLISVLNLLVETLRPILGDDLTYLKNRCETVLINSNFNCGYFINRDKLFHLMKYKYRINSNYDSCSYPGIQCKFYYIPGQATTMIQNGQQPPNLDNSKYYEISFMIFRTGSILIVGKCNEAILMTIYDFIRKILEDEFHSIQMGLIENALLPSTVFDPDTGIAIQQQTPPPKKVSKSRRKIIILKNIEPFHFDE